MADPGTHADLIATLEAIALALPSDDRVILARVADALEKADRQLKAATDALEKIADFPVDVQSGNSNFKSGLARSALAAVRQEPQP